MDRLEITVAVQPNDKPNGYNVQLLFDKNQRLLSVQQCTHILISAVALLVKSCEKADVGIKDHELIEEVMDHLNQEFLSTESHKDIFVHPRVFEKNKDA